MEKWCVKVTAENLRVVGNWFNENSQDEDLKSGRYVCAVFIGGYYHYPLLQDGFHYGNSILNGYTEITFEQFKEQILKEPNQLQEILDKIREKTYHCNHKIEVVEMGEIEEIFAEYLNK